MRAPTWHELVQSEPRLEAMLLAARFGKLDKKRLAELVGHHSGRKGLLGSSLAHFVAYSHLLDCMAYAKLRAEMRKLGLTWSIKYGMVQCSIGTSKEMKEEANRLRHFFLAGFRTATNGHQEKPALLHAQDKPDGKNGV